MTIRPFIQLDVFADRPGAGNPLAVVLDAEGLDDAAMQAIARWTRLPETTFVFPAPSSTASYGLRIFSPHREVPFAGHPSVGTAHVVLDAGIATARDGMLVQEGVAGLLPLRVTGQGQQRSIAIRTPRAGVIEVATVDDLRLVDALVGLPAGALPPALMDGGRRWWLAQVANETALRDARPAWPAIAALAAATQSMGVCAFARADAGSDYDLAVRAFVGATGPFEDAASGAANATLAAWLTTRDAVPGKGGRYRVSQGREVGFDARLELTIDDAGDVWSGGQACAVVSGTIDW